MKRIIFPTSNHAVGFYRRDRTIDHNVYPKPDGRYGVSKVFGEALGSLYADKYGMEMFMVRIGNVHPFPLDKRRLSIWFSPRDLAQLISIGIDRAGTSSRSSTASRGTSGPGTTTRTPTALAISRRTMRKPMPETLRKECRATESPVLLGRNLTVAEECRIPRRQKKSANEKTQAGRAAQPATRTCISTARRAPGGRNSCRAISGPGLLPCRSASA